MPSTYTPIATTTLGSAASSVTFSSIPSTYTDLVIVIAAKYSSGGTGIYLGYNSDTGTNYSLTALSGNGSSASSFRNTNVGPANIADVDSTAVNAIVVNVMNYSNTTTYKTAFGKGGASATYVTSYLTMWRNTAAINTVTLGVNSGTLTTGSTFTLYGVKSA